MENKAQMPYVLIADDDPDDLLILADGLREAYREVAVKTVADGDEVLDWLASHPGQLPQLIILDYKMPRLSGADVLRQISANDLYKVVPVVVWTTSGRENEMQECLELGAERLFVKPTTDKELMRIVVLIGDVLNARTDRELGF